MQVWILYPPLVQKTLKKFQVQGTTIKKKIFPQDERDRDRFVHVYYNELIAAVERRKLEEKISKWEKELSKSIDRKVCQGNLDCYTKLKLSQFADTIQKLLMMKFLYSKRNNPFLLIVPVIPREISI